MSTFNISDSVIYVGADDKKLDLFESQYKIPDGVSYNSYVIKDSKMVVMDTVVQLICGLIILKRHLPEKHLIIL